ncbi:hypothetical protein KIN20_028717 [Parelaphostrongylus tenuis]|uniref:Uncharacterized protein n=1 Tax=Parelaphostrongylus tenuis TaxID=148309 RepID=A0AAD5R200_PARTN|nr:hypothetical protein KIN20_028717 [Parelaphostrongylus tenuis]
MDQTSYASHHSGISGRDRFADQRVFSILETEHCDGSWLICCSVYALRPIFM